MMHAFFKTLLYLALLLISALMQGQNGLSWSAPMPVADSGFGNANARLTLLPGGIPVAVWGKPTPTPSIWCARWEGSAFGTPVQLNTGSQWPSLFGFAGIDIASWGQRVFVVFETHSVGAGIFLARSENGGLSWQSPDTVFLAPPGMGATISAIAVDEAGNPMVSFLLQTAAETNAHVHLARSTDGGLTFATSTNASLPADGGQSCECCYQQILPAGGDTVFVAFRSNRSNLRDMWVTRSTDGGQTFDAACDVDAQDWVINACPFSGPQLAQLAGDSLLAVWMSKGSGAVQVYGSTVHGKTMSKGHEFAFPGTSGAVSYSQNHPDVAGQRDTVAVVWEETGFATGQDIVCAFSTKGASGLVGNIADLTLLPGTQKFPQLAYANGIFHLIYDDGADKLAYLRGQVVATSAISETGAMTTLRVHPNPAGEFLFLESEVDFADANILTATGLLVKTMEVKAGRIAIGFLTPGIYFLQVSGREGQPSLFQRFIKQ